MRYFKATDDTLDQAQRNKLEHICRKLRLQRGERLLDIGCGWGALVCWAAREHGVRAHGITLSQQQLEYARERIRSEGLQDLVTVELRDYRDLEGTAVFDKVSSIGMFEHVGLANLPAYYAVVQRVCGQDSSSTMGSPMTRRAGTEPSRPSSSTATSSPTANWTASAISS
jgi:cyclopropane-fatty-acyl-phospholipid synthase